MKKEVALLYRSTKNKRYSIENLFYPLEKYEGIKKVVLPEDLNSFASLFKLVMFSIRIKQKLIHITGDVNYIAVLLFWKKTILTVHDLNHYETLTGIKKYIYGFIWFYLPLRTANKVVVVSPYTKLQLLSHFKLNEKKIVVIPNSFLKFYSSKALVFENNPSRLQILCIGNTENKNIDRLIDALEASDNVYLRLIGKQPEEIVNKMINKNIAFSILMDLTREELNIEYESSNLLYFASTKEGFGLPILEAQSLGIPVITSNTTAMPYVAGDSAIIVDPYSVQSIRDAILSFVDGKIKVEDLKEKGYINIERFSEINFVEAYIKIYNSIL